MTAAALWRRLRGSLVGRLVLAQMLTVLLLWSAAMAYFVWDTARYDEIFEPGHMGPRADMILALVDSLADRPEQLQEVLRKLDVFQRRENHEQDDLALRMSMNVWLGDRLLYASPGSPGVVPATQQRRLEKLVIDGLPWRTYTQPSARSAARVTLIRSGHAVSILFALGERGILILPLLISLPFLVLPAWWSVRLALRPWRRFSQEIETRSPGDLAPLRFGSAYRELRPVADAVNTLLARVAASLARERSFIADAAHELRTPLAAMRINIEALQAHRGDARDAELLDGLVRSGERASRLVAQLLGLMRSDSGRTQVVRLSLDGLVQDRLAALSGLAMKRGVELELACAERCEIEAEREGLTSLVDNLVENAIKYAPAGSTVSVRVGADASLVVEDAGPGIAADWRERVFDRFFRVPDQAQPGSGLGLAIVKSVADRHGATVELADGAGGAGGAGGSGGPGGPEARGLRVTVRWNMAGERRPHDGLKAAPMLNFRDGA